ncbi:MAG: hypothetical protein K2Q22_05325, partial [Cytophagales bacterium]|nr:hypothetical protein [Cytophagales bacterium]
MNVSVVSHSLVSPLGVGTETHAQQLLSGKLAISLHDDPKYSTEPFYGAIVNDRLLDEAFSEFGNPQDFTKLEKMALVSTKKALASSPEVDPTSVRTIIVFSTTKGNIDLFTQPQVVPTTAYNWDSA